MIVYLTSSYWLLAGAFSRKKNGIRKNERFSINMEVVTRVTPVDGFATKGTDMKEESEVMKRIIEEVKQKSGTSENAGWHTDAWAGPVRR